MSGQGTTKRTGSGQFRKGVSGNPNGRPKKSRATKASASAFDIIIDKTLTVTKGGAPREMSVEEVLQRKTYQQALDGNRVAQREILRMLLKRDKARTKPAPIENSKVDVIIEHRAKEIDEAVMILGIGHPVEGNYSRWKLKTWAAQMAMSRRRGAARMTHLDVQSIREGCLEPEALEWPKGMDDELR